MYAFRIATLAFFLTQELGTLNTVCMQLLTAVIVLLSPILPKKRNKNQEIAYFF